MPVSSLWHFPSPVTPRCYKLLDVSHLKATLCTDTAPCTWLCWKPQLLAHSIPYSPGVLLLSGSRILSGFWWFKHGLLREIIGICFSPGLNHPNCWRVQLFHVAHSYRGPWCSLLISATAYIFLRMKCTNENECIAVLWELSHFY